jgi:hypothetical protein
MSQTQNTDTRIADEQIRDEPLQGDDLATAPPDLPLASDAAPKFDRGTTGEEVVLLENADDYQRRWEPIQSAFVDEPRRAVEQADALVTEVIKALADSFSNEQQRLENQWSSGDNVSTDDLRIALQRYRSFFQRLLSR